MRLKTEVPSPICCTGLIEIKCPYSARNYTVQEAIQNNVKDFCLVQNGENIDLKENHQYYFQVQGQLLVTGMPFCDFEVYTKDDIFIKRIQPNRDIMLNILRKMVNFYIEEFIPYMAA